MTPKDFQKLRNRATAAKTHYQTYWQPKHEELTHYIMPEIGRFADNDSQPNDGKKRFDKVVDHAAGVAANKTSGAFLDGLTPPNRDWVKLISKQKDLMEIAEVRTYVEDVTRIFAQSLHDTNAYNQMFNAYRELIVAGTTATYIDSDPITVSTFHTYTIGEYFFTCDKVGRPNKFYRYFNETADNVVDKFGEANVSHRVQALIANNTGYEYVKIVHTIEPNTKRDPEKLDNKNMTYSSVYYEEAAGVGEAPLRESGYEDFPVIIARYDAVGDEVWGQGPCNRVLGITKSLQEMWKDFMKASKKTIDPMLNVPNTLKGIKRGAGGANYYSAAEGAPKIEAVYQIKYDAQYNLLASERLRDEINQILMVDLFAAISRIDRTGMTATEVAQRVAESLRQMVAILARLVSEYLIPLVERQYKLLDAAGMFPEPPEQLDGQDLDILFVSPLAQAQQATEITAIEQLIDVVSRIASIDPSVLDKFDSWQTLDEYIEKNGAPIGIVRDDDAASKIAAERAALEAAARTQAALSEMATGAEKLGNTPMNTGSALDGVMGGVSGEQQ